MIGYCWLKGNSAGHKGGYSTVDELYKNAEWLLAGVR